MKLNTPFPYDFLRTKSHDLTKTPIARIEGVCALRNLAKTCEDSSGIEYTFDRDRLSILALQTYKGYRVFNGSESRIEYTWRIESLTLKTQIMIVKSMSADEVLKELQKDDIWILDRVKGLSEKNAKKLKSKFVKNNEILSVSNYVIPETQDRAVVYATKAVIELKGKEYASLNLSYYIKTEYGTYILPCIEFNSDKVVRYVEFSPHSIDRIEERLKKGFDVFYRDDYVIKNRSVFQLEKYEYNHNENEFVAHVGDAFIIVKRYGVKDSVKTVLSTGYLHSNQLKLKLDSKIGGESYLTEVDRNNTATGERYLKKYKTSGILRGIA